MVKPFRILVVCTANICRSPMSEFLLRAAFENVSLNSNLGWSIKSAGTHGQSGHPMHPHALDVLSERGLDQAKQFRSRRLTEELIEESDLILTASREHRATVAQLIPSATRRTYTLRQAGGLSKVNAGLTPHSPPVANGEMLMNRLAAGRSAAQPTTAREDNLDDPIGRRLRAFRKCARIIDANVAQLVGLPFT